MNDNILYIYCDGGCKVHTSKIGGYGIVLRYNGNEKLLSGSKSNTTNNQMEILASITALEAVKNKEVKTIVTTDSNYVVQGISKWISSWKNNNWKTSARKSVLNADLWKQLDKIVNEFKDIKFIHCYGHEDTEGNIMADKLATNAMENHKE